MISGLKYLLALTSIYQKEKGLFYTQFKEREGFFTIMNTNEISGKRQFGISWQILIISRGRELQEKKKQQRKDSRKLWTVWRGESSGRIFFFDTFQIKTKLKVTRAIHKKNTQ